MDILCAKVDSKEQFTAPSFWFQVYFTATHASGVQKPFAIAGITAKHTGSKYTGIMFRDIYRDGWQGTVFNTSSARSLYQHDPVHLQVPEYCGKFNTWRGVKLS